MSVFCVVEKGVDVGRFPTRESAEAHAKPEHTIEERDEAHDPAWSVKPSSEAAPATEEKPAPPDERPAPPAPKKPSKK